jgi:hypothetical protein
MKEQDLGHGNKIIGFESMEEMQAYMAEQEQQGIKYSLDEQWRITWGSHVVRVVDELWIFGEIFTESRYLELNGPVIEEDLDEEARYELDALRDSHARGYRYGRWFSIVEPEGEYGSAHVVNLWEIDRSDFERARAARWEVPPDLAYRVGQEVGDALQKKERQQE